MRGREDEEGRTLGKLSSKIPEFGRFKIEENEGLWKSLNLSTIISYFLQSNTHIPYTFFFNSSLQIPPTKQSLRDGCILFFHIYAMAHVMANSCITSGQLGFLSLLHENVNVTLSISKPSPWSILFWSLYTKDLRSNI
ncbi:unnamed protein product [Cuscuta epithymum]|uniref:Uncharacterized protein n=1 Tax=Cuscuta epithymum TaxID=186058 RepID=A0AAV0BYE6_9ASTE|nr:unnamed protein product [Cuscuta epithymum]